jgi:hypothetical protein
MAQNDTGNVAYQRGQKLKITKRTVSFGNNVYQFKNITGFSEETIYKATTIPWFFIVIGAIAGIIALSEKEVGIGIFVLLVCAICIVINNMKKEEYGLILTLNSGGRHMFITSDHKMLSELIQKLYHFMDSDQDGMYAVTINDNSIKIEGNMIGVAASGTGNTTISSNASHSGDKE